MISRRAVLNAGAVSALAGCLGELRADEDDDLIPEDTEDTILSPPEQPRGSPSHPIFGEEFPEFSIPDPHADEMVTGDTLTERGPFVFTFIYTSCEDRCGDIMGLVRLIQHDAIEEGWDGDFSIATMTFDPETDDPETLLQYGNTYGVDVEHPGFRFLRPEDPSRAIELVDSHFGVPAQHEDHDHDHDHDDHDDHDDSDQEHEHDDETYHYYMMFLVNEQGVVERSYPSPVLFDRSPDDLVGDVRTVVTA